MPDLPPIREDAVLDATQYVAALQAMAAEAEKAAAAQDRLLASIKATQDLMDSMAAGAAEAAAAEAKLAGEEASVAAAATTAAAAEDVAAAASVRLAEDAAMAAATQAALADAITGAARAASTAAFAGQAMAFADSEAARAALMLAGAQRALADSTGTAGRVAAAAARGFTIFGIAAGTLLHWVVAAGAEFLAVAIPATVALAAGLAVAAQGAQNVQRHFQALYAATESTASAMHQTVGSVLGLGSALQKAQDAANPGVYEVLGSVVNDARTRFSDFAGMGLQVVHMFDEFSARVTVDLQGALGSQLHGLLAGAVTDLQRFGQILGNVGHAILSFASAMPGLAGGLLALADGISRVILWVSQLPPWLITSVMALEEFYRWGGVALGMVTRLGAGFIALVTGNYVPAFILKFGQSLLTLVSAGGAAVQWIGQMVGKLGAVIPVATEAGAAIETLGFDMKIAGATMGPGMVAGIAGAAFAVAGLIFVLSRVKDATDQWVASTDQAVKSASDLQVFNTIAKTMAQNAIHLSSAQKTLATDMAHTATQSGEFTARFGAMNGGVQRAAQDVMDLTQQQQYLIGVSTTVGTNIGLLAGHFHTSAVGALALANAAGVNLQVPLLGSGAAAKIAEQQIINLKAGLGAMAAPAAEIGADMQAVGIQSQLAASKVQTVNQAMDALVGATTGGMNSIMQFNGALGAMGKDTAARSQSIDGAIRSISASAAKMGFTLQGIGPHAQQSWQQFDAAVQQGNSILDTFRTGMAEGIVTQKQYDTEIKAVGGSLLPFAAHNRTALGIVSQLSQEMGNPATHNLKTLASEFGITGKAAQNMATVGMEQLIAKMSNMSTVARNLSATVGTQLTGAMASAITKFSGMNSAVSTYAKDLGSAHPSQTQLHADLGKISSAASTEYKMISDAAKGISTATRNTGALGSAAKGAATSTGGLTAKVKDTQAALMNQAISAKTASLNAQELGQQAHTAAGSASGLATQAGTATTQVRNLGSASTVTQGHLGNVNNEIRTAASLASGASGPLGGMAGNIRNVGSAASTAAGQVHALASAIAGLQSKTITVTTNVVTVTSTVHRAMGGPVLPGFPYEVGEAGRELFVPAVPGYIFSHAQTEQMRADAGTKTGTAAAASPAPAAGAGGGPGTLVIQMNGREVARALMPELWRWQARNRGTVDGILKPS